MLQLFKFIQADLTLYRSRKTSGLSNGFADESTAAFDPIGTAEPTYPKSLYLLEPLFSTYDLNPVAPEAQASIPVPECLDLDAWIVPEAKPPDPEVVVVGKKKRKDKKGKGKEKYSGDGASRPKKSKKKAAVDVPELTQEQIAEAEALATVSTSSCMILMNEADDLFTG